MVAILIRICFESSFDSSLKLTMVVSSSSRLLSSSNNVLSSSLIPVLVFRGLLFYFALCKGAKTPFFFEFGILTFFSSTKLLSGDDELLNPEVWREWGLGRAGCCSFLACGVLAIMGPSCPEDFMTFRFFRDRS